jgi:hypothetical protein
VLLETNKCFAFVIVARLIQIGNKIWRKQFFDGFEIPPPFLRFTGAGQVVLSSSFYFFSFVSVVLETARRTGTCILATLLRTILFSLARPASIYLAVKFKVTVSSLLIVWWLQLTTHHTTV